MKKKRALLATFVLFDDISKPAIATKLKELKDSGVIYAQVVTTADKDFQTFKSTVLSVANSLYIDISFGIILDVTGIIPTGCNFAVILSDDPSATYTSGVTILHPVVRIPSNHKNPSDEYESLLAISGLFCTDRLKERLKRTIEETLSIYKS